MRHSCLLKELEQPIWIIRMRVISPDGVELEAEVLVDGLNLNV